MLILRIYIYRDFGHLEISICKKTIYTINSIERHAQNLDVYPYGITPLHMHELVVNAQQLASVAQLEC